ncbi:hypothetical protein OIU77_030132 [Salix suchowensis]|uniref:Uncharacterized protein n=1 Tax=Salix suchowensis TaxID=1278906 RepID=A0ABQ9BCN1_9ROSI|nr:DEAD-box ATP-dependent RNA helicase [Salix suchowensis]KAJ6381391.1 hypothetical protein OIU77_030132 [Salix suchowensis]
MSISIPTLHLSFSKTLSSQNALFFPKPFSLTLPPKTTMKIRMGGGPRTFPGGVSKWQWKRMQKNKAKQLLKARLCRERQIYEMRKRAELKAAVSELERPWEVVDKAPKLFSVGADEQVKVLADRFQKPGGFDLWSERDGPQLFETPDGVPSARFFPKGVVQIVKSYGKVSGSGFGELGTRMLDSDFGSYTENEYQNDGMSVNEKLSNLSETEDGSVSESGYRKNSDGKLGMDKMNAKRITGKYRKKANRRFENISNEFDSGKVGFEKEKRVGGTTNRSAGRDNRISRSDNDSRIYRKRRDSKSDVYDMNLQQDGRYGFQVENEKFSSSSWDVEAFEFDSF